MHHKSLVIDDMLYLIGGCTLSGQEKNLTINSRLSCLKGFIQANFQPLNFARQIFTDKSNRFAQSNKPREYEIIDKYNFETNTWSQAPIPVNNSFCMIRRRRHGCCVADGKIYIAGGINGSGLLNSFQVNDSFVDENDDYVENAWLDLPEMPTERFDLGLDSLFHRGEWSIFAVGGISHKMLNTSVIEKFELSNNQWTTITHISLSNIPVIADGFSGGCRIFVCRQQNCYDLVTLGNDADGESVLMPEILSSEDGLQAEDDGTF